MAIKKGTKRGFTLVELMIVVAIIGVLAALAIYGVRRYVFTAKTAEAKEGVGRMAKDASSAFNAEKMAGTVLTLGGTVAGTGELCSGAGATVPAAPANIQGKKYQSSPSDWSVDASTGPGGRAAGFECLGFSMQDPQYYMYDYNTGAELNSAGGTFAAVAQGDLDGDTKLSTYTLAGAIQSSGEGTVVTVAPNFVDVAPLE